MEEYSDFIIIDGINYKMRAKLTGLKRSADFLDKYANRTDNGDLKREIIGVYFNYSNIQFEKQTDFNYAEYNKLFSKLTEPTEFHNIKIGNFEFIAYFSGVTDECYKYKNGKTYFRNLTVNFTAKKPARS